jgi:hypothetical protein
VALQGASARGVLPTAVGFSIERRAFDAVGGFTSGYWYGPEDLDLGLKLREHGMRSRNSGRSLLVHRPNTTLGAVGADRRREWMRGNRRLFAQRWGPRVRREFELDRLAGGGLWSEPGGAAGAASDVAGWQALGYCLRLVAAGDGGNRALAAAAALEAELARRGARRLVLQSAEVDALPGLELDVAIHIDGGCRYEAPAPAQLNVLWRVEDGAGFASACCAPYDFVAGACEPDVLIAAIEAYARDSRFPARIDRTEATLEPSFRARSPSARAGAAWTPRSPWYCRRSGG